MKWDNGAGPRKSKAVVELLRALRQEIQTHAEKTGVVGGEEHTAVLWSPFGGPVNEVAAAEWKALGESFAWRFTNESLHALEVAAKAALERARAGRPVVDKRQSPEEDAERKVEIEKRERKIVEERTAAEAAWAAILAKKPAGATALIVAEHEKDTSDAMTDYFATSTERVVAIGWRFGAREDFRQLRTAAAAFPETAHLGPDAPKDIEHRDNFSMGSGNYLKAGGHYSTGWRVRSRSLSAPGHVVENRLPEPKTPAAPTNGDGFAIRPSSLGKAGIVEVVFESKPEADVRGELKAAGFRWAPSTGCWYGPEAQLPAKYKEAR